MTENNTQNKQTTPPAPGQKLALHLDLKRHLIFWPVFLFGVAVDLFTKSLIFSYLSQSPQRAIPVIDGFIRLVYAENIGAAFGIAAGQRSLLIAVSTVALVVIFAVLFTTRTTQALVHFALALLAAGVSGNLYDRIFNHGKVRDFIDIVYWPNKHWPAFNAADTMLCVGVALMIIASLRDSYHTENSH